MTYKKKLIEVALPLDAINAASAREKSIRHGHPSTLHLWWARRPLAAARAVIFAQMVDDPSEHTDVLLSDPAQKRAATRELHKRLEAWNRRKAAYEAARGGGNGSVPDPGPEPTLEGCVADLERERLFGIIEELVKWENTTNEQVLQQARDEIWQSWRYTCAENADHPRARELFDRHKLPAFHDPFAGGGALPLEAQRLGLEAYASDLNPVAVLINKAMIEIPPRFANRPPVNPESRKEQIGNREVSDGATLQRPDRMAEGDGGGTRGLPAGAEVAAGGDLWDAVADHTRSGLDSGEYRRGVGEGIGQGEGAVFGDRAWLAGGKRDVVDPLRTGGVVPGVRDEDVAGALGRSGTDADDDEAESEEGNRGEKVGNRGEDTLLPISYRLFSPSYRGAQGLAEDVRYYGKWMRDEAEKRIGHLYPKVEITAEMAQERPDLKPYVGQKLTVIAWIWARTVKSPNPAFADVDVPLASTFMLSTKPGKEAYVEPMIEDGGYRFTVKVGRPKDAETANRGTKLSRGANFQCLMSGTPMSGDHIKAEGRSGRMGAKLMAIVAEGERGRLYLSPTPEHEMVSRKAKPDWKPEGAFVEDARAFTPCIYGITEWQHLFTARQLVALATFSDLVQEAREWVKRDALVAGFHDDAKSFRDGGIGATAYAEAIDVYLAFVVSRLADYWTTLNAWQPFGQKLSHTFGRQAIPMLWDYAEANPHSGKGGSFTNLFDWTTQSIADLLTHPGGSAIQANAATQLISSCRIVSTDPPYYDNVPYADLSDFFYVWLRRSLKPVFPDLFATLAVPKAEELVAFAYRHEGGKLGAENFFLDGMTQAIHRLAEQAHPAFPVTIFYAFKQVESDSDEGTTSTGWETFLDAVIRAGFATSGTWPMRTELSNRMRGMDSNALASSIILVCRKHAADTPTATRREFVSALKTELPIALAHLQRANIAPVDLAQAAIGPGMAVYTRYAKVLDAAGNPVPVREALALINQTLDEALAEQEGDFDADSRWALAWFEQSGFAEGEYGVAETLSKAKNTSVAGMVDAGILVSSRGKVRLLRPNEMQANWDPAKDRRLTAWESVHQLIRALETGGEAGAADLAARLGSQAETARELAYRLYTICERKKRAAEALWYNGLVQSWPEIARLAADARQTMPMQPDLFAAREGAGP